MKQQAIYKIIGMQKDVADSAMDKQHAFDIHNMRLSHDDKNTLTALVNELGTLKARGADGNPVSIKGTVIGFTTLNKQAILFTHEEDGIDYQSASSIPVDKEVDTDKVLVNNGALHSPRRSAADKPLVELWFCSYKVNLGTDELYNGHGCYNVKLRSTDTELVFTVEADFFAPEGFVYSDDIIISTPDASVSMRTGSDAFSASSLHVNKDLLNNGGVNDYSFDIKIALPERTDEDQKVSGSVNILAGFVTGNDVDMPLAAPIEINFSVDVPALGTSSEAVPVVVDSIDRICRDYAQETSAKTCDHIYIVTTEKHNDFTASGNDTYVSVFEYFRGDLGFSALHPIESTVYFENEEIQKVYWVDGINPLRYANIAERNGTTYWTDNMMFESVPFIHMQEDVTVERNSTGGTFPSGTVQFAFTYLNRYGAESNIAWISPIYYSCPEDRGGAPDEICANSFTIRIRKYEPDGRFDYIRLYHIVHTTLDAEVEVRRVADIPVPVEWDGTIVYTDTNTTGESVDPNELLYLGGMSVVPNTLEQKSNTLFLGNLKNTFKYLKDVDFTNNGSELLSWGGNTVNFINPASTVKSDRFSGYYSHENQLRYNSWQVTSFRCGEDYRFGFQAQDGTGRWSDVWFLGDCINTSAYPKYSDNKLVPVHATFTLTNAVVNKLRTEGYRKVRPVVVYPQPWERNIYTEGLLNPTVYNVKDRANNAPFAQSSWFLRPFSPIDLTSFSIDGVTLDDFGNYSWSYANNDYVMPLQETHKFRTIYEDGDSLVEYTAIDSLFDGDSTSTDSADHNNIILDCSSFGSWAEFRHNHPLGDSQQRNGEVQSMYSFRPEYETPTSESGYALRFPHTPNFEDDKKAFINKYADFFYVDQSILTMNSADIEFDSFLQSTKLDGISMRISGIVPIHSFVSSCDIRTNTPPNKFWSKDNDSLYIPQGFYNSETVGAMMDKSGYGWRSFISAPVWHDDLAWHTIELKRGPSQIFQYAGGPSNMWASPIGFAVYPWQAQGSLNNDSAGSRKVYPTKEGDDSESKSLTGNNYISAELKYKTIANMHYSHNTYAAHDFSLCNPIGVKTSVFLDTQSVSLTKVDTPDSSVLDVLSDIHYFGNVDKLISPVVDPSLLLDEAVDDGDNDDSSNTTIQSDQYPLTRFGGYPKMVSYLPYYKPGAYDQPSHLAFMAPYSPMRRPNMLTGDSSSSGFLYNLKAGADRTMAPITMRYNSCNHIIVALDYDNGNTQNILGWSGGSILHQTDGTAFWPHGGSQAREFSLFSTGGYFDDVEVVTPEDTSYRCMQFDGRYAGFLYMGQLYRNTPVPNKFGGTTEEALEQNVWLPAGEAKYLDPAKTEGVQLEWSAGDTYYQRYDALRTYPQTEEDMNKIVDIVSFMTETHTNIDGRYDKNRGLTNNNHVRPTNFNKLNYVYSQRDNFFTYSTLNSKKVHLDTFRYSFNWSMVKTAGSLRDEWTRMIPSNYYDLDGNKGELTRIVRLDNMLVAFQDSGVSQILFNENVQIQGSEGLPIELANSGRMQGLRYYTTEVGCQNKWSVAVAPSGIFFIDGKSKGLYTLGADGIQNVSAAQGFSSWFKARSGLLDVWNPSNWQGFFSHWDSTTGELFLTAKDTCLCFDTSLGVFSSFYDYQKTDAMFVIGDDVLTVHTDDALHGTMQDEENKRYDQIWLHRKNKVKHCFIYNQQRESSLEIVCNSNVEGSDYGMDKIFDNMTWRSVAQQWISNPHAEQWSLLPFSTFTDISGFDNYQTFSSTLRAVNTQDSSKQDSLPAVYNLRKKFDVWHTTIPRADSAEDKKFRDRIRDTWCHIRLTLDKDASIYRHVLHDVVISYFIP